MSGSHSQIITCCTSEFNAPESNFKSLFARGLRIILENQFVRVKAAKLFPQLIYRVREGTGMGSLLSGDASDLTFYSLCERPYALSPAARRSFGVCSYGRFKDDGLVVFNHCDQIRQDAFFREFRSRALPYVLTVDDMEPSRVSMLDVTFFKGQDFSVSHKLQFQLYLKQTSVWRPLSPWSSHPWSVHASWPKSQEVRNGRRFSSSARAGDAVSKFWEDLVCAFGVSVRGDQATIKRNSVTISTQPKSLWMVLPHRLCWAQARIANVISKCLRPEDAFKTTMGDIRLSWRLGSPHLCQVLKRINTELG